MTSRKPRRRWVGLSEPGLASREVGTGAMSYFMPRNGVARIQVVPALSTKHRELRTQTRGQNRVVPHLRLGVMGATTWLFIVIGVAINLSLKSGHSWLAGALNPEIFK